MKKITCIAVDDEPLALELIKSNLIAIPSIELKGCFPNVKKAKAFLEKEKADLLFLDIQMPGITGMEFAKTLTADPMIIFTTAYDKYAIEGFEVNAVDYLLKPVSTDRFKKACEKALELFRWKNSEKKTDHIFINSEHRVIKISLNELLYVEGLKDYVKLFLSGESKPVLTRLNLKGIQELLPESDFMRIHKSYIINLSRMRSRNSDSVFIEKIKIPLGESYKNELKNRF